MACFEDLGVSLVLLMREIITLQRDALLGSLRLGLDGVSTEVVPWIYYTQLALPSICGKVVSTRVWHEYTNMPVSAPADAPSFV